MKLSKTLILIFSLAAALSTDTGICQEPVPVSESDQTADIAQRSDEPAAAARLRKILRDVEDNPIQQVDRDQMLADVRKLFRKIRARQRSAILKETPETPVDSAPDQPCDDSVQDELVQPANFEQIVRTSVDEKAAVDATETQSEADGGSMQQLESRISVLEQEMSAMNRKLKWLYRTMNQPADWK